MNEFWNDEINVGYYDKIVKIGVNKKKDQEHIGT